MKALQTIRTASAATSGTEAPPVGALADCRRTRARLNRARPARLRCGKLLAVAALLLYGTAGWAVETSHNYGGALTITVENDVFTGSDNNYTNGIGVSWVSNEVATYDEQSLVRRWAKFWSFLPFIGDQGSRTFVAWSIAQEMHTPDDIENPDPPLDDQPYAGVLYLDSVIYAKNDRWAHAWQLRVGVVGPASQAEGVQRWFHSATGSPKPLGWSTQLPNELVVNVGYTGSYLLASGDLGGSASWRVIPVANVGLGNYFPGAGLGLYGEVGWNLVDAMGGTALRQGFNSASTVGVGPVKGWSVSLSGGFSGYGIVRYLPLDGTLFKNSRSVDSEPFVGMGTLGLSVRHKNFVFFAGRTYFTKTFETERRNPEFGTMSASWYF